MEDKLSISTIFLFCHSIGTETFSELLYTKSPKKFIKSLEKEYGDYDIILKVRLGDKGILTAFNKTIEEVKSKYDKDGFYKAVFEKDSFAMAIVGITNTIFNKECFLKKIDSFNKTLTV